VAVGVTIGVGDAGVLIGLGMPVGVGVGVAVDAGIDVYVEVGVYVGTTDTRVGVGCWKRAIQGFNPKSIPIITATSARS
jgi:hypothetical protein